MSLSLPWLHNNLPQRRKCLYLEIFKTSDTEWATRHIFKKPGFPRAARCARCARRASVTLMAGFCPCKAGGQTAERPRPELQTAAQGTSAHHPAPAAPPGRSLMFIQVKSSLSVVSHIRPSCAGDFIYRDTDFGFHGGVVVPH